MAVFPVARALTPFLLRDKLPLCPFRCVTGQPCPFCGLTRAMAEAAHFRWREAFHFNPLWPACALVIVVFAVSHLIDAFRRTQWTARIMQGVQTRWLFLLVLLIAYDVWRIGFLQG